MWCQQSGSVSYFRSSTCLLWQSHMGAGAVHVVCDGASWRTSCQLGAGNLLCKWTRSQNIPSLLLAKYCQLLVAVNACGVESKLSRTCHGYHWAIQHLQPSGRAIGPNMVRDSNGYMLWSTPHFLVVHPTMSLLYIAIESLNEDIYIYIINTIIYILIQWFNSCI